MNTRQIWLNGITTGMVASSLIIFFWLPLLFVMPPGTDYRPMCSAPLSIIIVIACIIYAVNLGMKQVSHAYHRKIKIYAIVLNLMPMVLFVVLVLLLRARGNFWSP